MCSTGAPMALHRQRVLILPGDLVLLGDIFRGHAHVTVIKRIAEGCHHHIDHLRVIHPRAETHGLRAVGTATHILGPAGDGHLGIAEHDRLRACHDRLQTAAAEPVQSQRRRLVGQTPIDTCNPRQVMVVGIGVNDIAENDVTDVFDIDSGAGDGFLYTRCGHFTGRDILQAAAVSADCRSNSAKNYNFSIHIKLG